MYRSKSRKVQLILDSGPSSETYEFQEAERIRKMIIYRNYRDALYYTWPLKKREHREHQ